MCYKINSRRYDSSNYLACPKSTQKLPETSLILTMYFNIQAMFHEIQENKQKISEIDEKIGNRSTSNSSTGSSNGRNLEIRVQMESSGLGLSKTCCPLVFQKVVYSHLRACKFTHLTPEPRFMGQRAFPGLLRTSIKRLFALLRLVAF